MTMYEPVGSEPFDALVILEPDPGPMDIIPLPGVTQARVEALVGRLRQGSFPDARWIRVEVVSDTATGQDA